MALDRAVQLAAIIVQADGPVSFADLQEATGLAKSKFVTAFVRLLLESEDKVVLWGWHRDVYDIWMRDLAEFNPVMYTGSESPTAKDAAKERFVNGDARVLVMSLHRDGQTDPVVGYYLVSDDGADPVMAEVLGVKRQQAERFNDPTKGVFEVVEIGEERRSHLLAKEVLRRHGSLAPARAA